MFNFKIYQMFEALYRLKENLLVYPTGDSGGPFACFYNGRYHLHGVVSFGDTDACELNAFTTVAPFISWIRKTANQMRMGYVSSESRVQSELRTVENLRQQRSYAKILQSFGRAFENEWTVVKPITVMNERLGPFILMIIICYNPAQARPLACLLHSGPNDER
uniref:Peptidase S1 domain-containing protein n=1 Tax=Romanomermis culicivorax TaxID=13658 RepID=A0A915KLU0_ROMCU